MTLEALRRDALEHGYELGRELGRGGMAIVYLARDRKHRRDVAIKVLLPEVGASLGTERFLAEIRLTASLQHPNVLPLFDSGSAGGVPYYVMPYVRGESLRARLARDGRLPVDEAVAIARGIAAALEHAHRQGVVHRDVKPENVLLSDGIPIVADFGIARALEAAGTTMATVAGVALGTPAYMSPEQAMGERDLDRRSDVYALGCVTFEMLTGVPPFEGPNAQALIGRHLSAPVPSAREARDDVPPAVDLAVRRAMAKERDARWAGAAEFAQALAAAPPVEPRPDYSQVTEPLTRNTEPLSGRRAEYAQLVAQLDALEAGRGGMVLVGGEPGVGKTKLVETLLLEARRRGHVCVVGHCEEMEGAPPYLPFVEQMEYSVRTVPPGRLRAALGDGAAELSRMLPRLRQLYPDIPEPLDLPPEQQRRYLSAKFTEYLERAAAVVPIVMFFDDLHWADESSLLLLGHLAAQAPRMRLLLLGTYRDVDLEVQRPFAQALERLTRQRQAQRVVLRRMPRADVAELLARLGAPNPPSAVVDAFYQRTEGNPFFVEELFRHLAQEGHLLGKDGRWRADVSLAEVDVPEGVKLVVGRRLERVGEACRHVLTAAAVIGPRFSVPLLEAVVGQGEDAVLDALEMAERAGLVLVHPGSREPHYAFAHELVRQTLLGTLSLPRRLRRHRDTADAIERLYGTRVGEHAAAMAYHCVQAGVPDAEKATRYLLQAGRQAVEAGAFSEGLALAERGLGVLDDEIPLRRAELLWLKASALRGAGDWTQALGALYEAIAGFDSARAVPQLVAATCLLAEMLNYLEKEETRGLLAIRRALDLAGDEPSVGLVQLLAAGAMVLITTEGLTAGLAWSDRAVAMAERVGTDQARSVALTGRAGMLWNGGDAEGSLEPAREGGALLLSAEKRWQAVWTKSRLAYALVYSGRLVEGVQMCRAAQGDARAIGHLGALYAFINARQNAEQMLVARRAELVANAEEIAAFFGGLGAWAELASLWRAWDAYHADRGDRAARESAGIGDRGHSVRIVDVYWMAEVMLAASADADVARGILSHWRHRDPLTASIRSIGAYYGIAFLVEGLLLLGDRVGAAALVPIAQESEAKLGLVRFHGVAGRAAAAAEDWDRAERHFTEALDFSTGQSAVLGEAQVRLWHAAMLAERGRATDSDRARAMLDRAMTVFERGEWWRRLREAHEVLARLK
ncbi:MAG: protein kinase [Gemmatimonadetes bacterium]|nr:protein kinase [Gemmatimonadota bacterium]